ncbi:MFS transporter [Rhodopila sp.]|uniref:MFS transporter n=1 Tax=Rhodopila sp. TaxID=2480087 RepID=UPI003D0FD0E6
MRKVVKHLIPLAIICYFVNYLDRVNLSFAALEMNKDLGFSATVYGFGAGVFFIAYFLLETPSNLLLVKLGARRWIARIMFTWGLLSGCMALVQGETSFYVVRFLLGAAEAGFFPGMLFYLSLFFPAAYRGRMVSTFMVATAFSAVFGAPVSSLILAMNGFAGLKGWQWVFLTEAVPALILSVVILLVLKDSPAETTWLDDDERAWLVARQAAERRQREAVHDLSVLQVLTNPRVVAFGLGGFGIAYSTYGIVYFLPQIVKQFGLTNLQTGFVSAIPFLVAAIGMIWYGRRSDRLMERRSHCAIAFMICAIGLVATALLPSPPLRLLALCVAAFGAWSTLPVFWSMPTAFLSGAAAAAGVAYINSIANIAGFGGPFIMGWIKDATGSFDGGLLVIACVSIGSAVAILCISHDGELERAPEMAARPQGATVDAN